MPAVSAVAIAILLWPLCGTEQQNPVNGEQRPDTIGSVPVAPLKLTNDRPSGSFQLSPETIAVAPPALSISIIQVVNPEKTAVEIFVYLARAEAAVAPAERIPVGQFGLFPPDHPAGFTLRSSNAFQKLRMERPTSKPSRVWLVLELKPISPTRPLTKIELTVAPPEWGTEKRN